MTYRAVIVDDEAKIIRLIEELGRWEGLGIEIADTCTTGSAGLASILRLQPDFVISDIKMPGLDGLELISRVRSAGAAPLFILISGYRHFEYARTAVSLAVLVAEGYGFRKLRKMHAFMRNSMQLKQA